MRKRRRFSGELKAKTALGGAPETIVPPSEPSGSATLRQSPSLAEKRQCTNIQTGPVSGGRSNWPRCGDSDREIPFDQFGDAYARPPHYRDRCSRVDAGHAPATPRGPRPLDKHFLARFGDGPDSHARHRDHLSALDDPRVSRHGLGGLSVAFLFGANGISLFVVAISNTGVANTLVIYATAPVIAALLSWIFLRER